jgi:phosphocarrier protein HPr
MPHTTATVGSAIGLKARPASIIADAVAELGIPMTLRLDGRDTPAFDATSSMEIAKLGAGPGASVIVQSDDEDANAAIASLIESDLDEE